MKTILTTILSFLTLATFAQRVYSPSVDGVPGRNQPIGISGLPTDGRSKFHDTAAAVLKWRDFQSTAEVNSYFNTATKRQGGFPIHIHSGGSLSAGVWTGGTTVVYWYTGTTDGDLVESIPRSTTVNGSSVVWNRKGVVLNATLDAEGSNTFEPNVIREAVPQILTDVDTVFKMWYSSGWTYSNLNYAESADGVNWTKYSGNPIIAAHNRGFVVKNGSTYSMFCVPSGLSQGNQVDRYTSSNGITWALTNAAILTKNTGAWNTSGVYNTAVIIDGGTWKMLVDGYSSTYGYSQGYYTSPNGSTWTEYGSNPVLSGNGQGAPWLTKIGNTFYAWVLGNSGAGNDPLPSDLFRYQSTNMTTWTQSYSGITFGRRMADEGAHNDLGQIADPFYLQVGNAVYLYYAASPDGDDSSARQQIKLAVANMPFSSLVTTNEGDGDDVTNFPTSSGIIGSGFISLPSFVKSGAASSFGTGSGIASISGGQYLFGYNNGTLRKFDAYDYVGDSSLPFEIGRFSNKVTYPGNNIFGTRLKAVNAHPWARITVNESETDVGKGTGIAIDRGRRSLILYNDSIAPPKISAYDYGTGTIMPFNVGDTTGTINYPGTNNFGATVTGVQPWERISVGEAPVGIGTGISVHRGAKAIFLYNDSTNLKLSAYNNTSNVFLPFLIGDPASTVTFPGTNIFSSTNLFPITLNGSGVYSRLVLNNTTASPNVGIFYQHNGVTKWQTFASGSNWYLQNTIAGTFPLSVDAATDAITASNLAGADSAYIGVTSSGKMIRRATPSGSGGGSGTVTSVSQTMPSGFSVSISTATTTPAITVTTLLNGVVKGNGSGFTAGNIETTDINNFQTGVRAVQQDSYLSSNDFTGTGIDSAHAVRLKYGPRKVLPDANYTIVDSTDFILILPDPAATRTITLPSASASSRPISIYCWGTVTGEWVLNGSFVQKTTTGGTMSVDFTNSGLAPGMLLHLVPILLADGTTWRWFDMP